MKVKKKPFKELKNGSTFKFESNRYNVYKKVSSNLITDVDQPLQTYEPAYYNYWEGIEVVIVYEPHRRRHRR